MFRIILLFFLFYFIYKAVKALFKYFSPEVQKHADVKNNNTTESKYKDAEEVEFKEIKTDEEKNKNE